MFILSQYYIPILIELPSYWFLLYTDLFNPLFPFLFKKPHDCFSACFNTYESLIRIFFLILPKNHNFSEEDEDATTWGGSDRDYTYDELLQRVYTIMKEKNPDTVVGETKKFVMRPPQVVKVGAKKTAFVNFAEIAKM